MPEVSRFLGIVISMFIDDHNPPHFHIQYGDYNAVYNIDKGIIRGEMPVSAIKSVIKWVDLHRDELLSNWQQLQTGGKAIKIEPL